MVLKITVVQSGQTFYVLLKNQVYGNKSYEDDEMRLAFGPRLT